MSLREKKFSTTLALRGKTNEEQKEKVREPDKLHCGEGKRILDGELETRAKQHRNSVHRALVIFNLGLELALNETPFSFLVETTS